VADRVNSGGYDSLGHVTASRGHLSVNNVNDDASLRIVVSSFCIHLSLFTIILHRKQSDNMQAQIEAYNFRCMPRLTNLATLQLIILQVTRFVLFKTETVPVNFEIIM